MSSPVVALLSTVSCPYTAAARVWIRGLLDDATSTAAQVEVAAGNLAADPRFRAAIDAALRDLREDNRRLLNRIDGGIETILAARRVGDPGHSAVGARKRPAVADLGPRRTPALTT